MAKRPAGYERDVFDTLAESAPSHVFESVTTPKKTAKKRKGRLIGGISAIVFLALAFGYVSFAFNAKLPDLTAEFTAQPQTFQAPAATIDWPGTDTGVTSAMGVLGEPTVLTGPLGDDPRPIASITKVITALLVLEKNPIAAGEAGPDIPFTDEDSARRSQIQSLDGSTLPVFPGESMSERDLLTGMLVASSNNYADKLAEWSYGSIDDFLVAARAWLADKGLTSIQLMDANGLSEQNVSSPSDLVRLGQFALRNPVIPEIVSLTTANLPLVGKIETTNTLLGQDNYSGIKTGTTDEAGYCVLFSRELEIKGEVVTVLGVVMGASSNRTRYDFAIAMGNSIAGDLDRQEVISDRAPVGTLTSVWGAKVNVLTNGSATALLWNEEHLTTSYAFEGTFQTVKQGENVGTVTTDKPGTEPVKLITDAPIIDPGPAWRLTHPFELLAAQK